MSLQRSSGDAARHRASTSSRPGQAASSRWSAPAAEANGSTSAKAYCGVPPSGHSGSPRPGPASVAPHPPAVSRTLAGLREAYPGRRLWAVFEPASSTNARSTFEPDYLDAFSHADATIIASVPRPERSRQDEPFSPQRLAGQLRERGIEAWHLSDTESITAHLLAHTEAGDIVVFMSNAGFGGVQAKTLAALQERSHV